MKRSLATRYMLMGAVLSLAGTVNAQEAAPFAVEQGEVIEQPVDREDAPPFEIRGAVRPARLDDPAVPFAISKAVVQSKAASSSCGPQGDAIFANGFE